jgi:cyanobactin maturation PatA/PatG family protease
MEMLGRGERPSNGTELQLVAGIAWPSLAGLGELWDETLGDPSIKVAILDGPFDGNHSCFAGANLKLLDGTLANTEGTGPALQHGTHVTSIIFGQHGTTVPGLAPRCSGVIIPVFSDGPDGTIRSCSQLDLARAIIQAVDSGAHIISISAGELSVTQEPEEYLRQAISVCADKNIMIVAAAGNDGCACLHIPAAVQSVLAVGAMNSSGLPLQMSNWGNAYQDHGILAPGENILGASSGEQTVRRTGTSFATAIVAGVAASLLSVQVKYGIRADPKQVRATILQESIGCELNDEVACRRFLTGRLDIQQTLNSIRNSFTENDSTMADGLRPSIADAVQSVKEKHSGILISSEINLIQEGAGPMDNQSAYQPEFSNQTPDTSGISSSRNDVAGTSAGVVPSCGGGSCSCGGGGGGCGCGGKCGGGPPKPSLVYALGLLGHDYQTEARRDSILQSLGKITDERHSLLDRFVSTPPMSAAVTWILSQDSTPIYAIQPSGPFASDAYKSLVETFKQQAPEKIEQVAIPGYLAGQTRLLNGQVVPVIVPEFRDGFSSWSVEALVKAIVQDKKEANPKAGETKAAVDQLTDGVEKFLTRIYYSLRNFGVLPQDRAINFAATNAYQAKEVFKSAIENQLVLDVIGVEKSPICRPGSDCWDVKLTFFDPEKMFQRARHVYRYTVDVSDVIPVTVGQVRDWDIYVSGV